MTDLETFHQAKALFAALETTPNPVFDLEGLTFTRLVEEGGPLHTGEADGIVYAACRVGHIDLPPSFDPVAELIARAPALLQWALRKLDAFHALEGCAGELDTCRDMECSACSIRECPHEDPMHFHHDGCPSCSSAPEGSRIPTQEGEAP